MRSVLGKHSKKLSSLKKIMKIIKKKLKKIMNWADIIMIN